MWNRENASPTPGHPTRSAGDAFATFDLEGRLLFASEGFALLLRQRLLVEDLLAIPRALMLRSACGYPPALDTRLASRRIWSGGVEHWVHARLADCEAAGVVVELSISSTPPSPAAPPPALTSQRAEDALVGANGATGPCPGPQVRRAAAGHRRRRSATRFRPLAAC